MGFYESIIQNYFFLAWPFHRPIRLCVLYVWTNVQNCTESTVIVHRVWLVSDLCVKHTIRRNRRDCTGFEVVEVVRGIGAVCCGLIPVVIT